MFTATTPTRAVPVFRILLLYCRNLFNFLFGTLPFPTASQKMTMTSRKKMRERATNRCFRIGEVNKTLSISQSAVLKVCRGRKVSKYVSSLKFIIAGEMKKKHAANVAPRKSRLTEKDTHCFSHWSFFECYSAQHWLLYFQSRSSGHQVCCPRRSVRLSGCRFRHCRR